MTVDRYMDWLFAAFLTMIVIAFGVALAVFVVAVSGGVR